MCTFHVPLPAQMRFILEALLLQKAIPRALAVFVSTRDVRGVTGTKTGPFKPTGSEPDRRMIARNIPMNVFGPMLSTATATATALPYATSLSRQALARIWLPTPTPTPTPTISSYAGWRSVFVTTTATSSGIPLSMHASPAYRPFAHFENVATETLPKKGSKVIYVVVPDDEGAGPTMGERPQVMPVTSDTAVYTSMMAKAVSTRQMNFLQEPPMAAPADRVLMARNTRLDDRFQAAAK